MRPKVSALRPSQGAKKSESEDCRPRLRRQGDLQNIYTVCNIRSCNYFYLGNCLHLEKNYLIFIHISDWSVSYNKCLGYLYL